MIQREITKLPHSEVEIKVSIPWDEWQKFRDSAFEELSEKITVDGFRPGKAPRNLIVQKIGEAKILAEAAKKAIQETYANILQEDKIEAIGAPEANILKLAPNNELEYKVRVTLVPKIKINSWRETIKKINQKYKGEKIEVSKEETDKELKKLADSRAKLVTVRRAAQKGDKVIIDFTVSQSGVPLPGGVSKNHGLILGRDVFIPGFEEQLMGMKEKEEKKFELDFPKEYHEKSIAGKKANFEVKMNLVQERQVPSIDDKFAKSLGKFENLEKLQKSVQEGILKERKTGQKEKQRAEFVEALIKASETDLPHLLIHEEIHSMLGEFEGQLAMMNMNLPSYLEKINKKMEDLEKEWEPQAQKRIKAALVLEAVAKEQDIKIANEKIEEEMSKALQYYKSQKEAQKNIDLQRLYNYVKGTLINEEVFKYLETL